MIFWFFYECALWLLALPMVIKMGSEMMRTGKYRTNFLPRLGWGFPHIEKGERELIWIHAVSLGETKAVAPLIKRLKRGDNVVVVSTATESGYREGKKVASEADYHVYLPFDLSCIIRPIVRRVAPDLVIVVESDFWFNFQDEAKRCGAQLFLINGKLSERSLAWYRRLPFAARALLHPFDRLLLQGELYASRFRALGISPHKMRVTGNIKLDGVRASETLFTREKLQLGEEPILTLGSTHDPEERLWIAALSRIWKRFPTLKVFLVPRHPERFESVAKLLSQEKIPFNRFSEDPYFGEKRVLLIDTIGLLRQCYALSTLAFVGGSLTKKVGGHNILEPAYYGVPVLYGPYMQGQPDFLELIERYGGGICIQHDLVEQTIALLADGERREEIGACGKKMVDESHGALEETLREIQLHAKLNPSSRDGAVVSSLGS